MGRLNVGLGAEPGGTDAVVELAAGAGAVALAIVATSAAVIGASSSAHAKPTGSISSAARLSDTIAAYARGLTARASGEAPFFVVLNDTSLFAELLQMRSD